jgi:hypothetical protein
MLKKKGIFKGIICFTRVASSYNVCGTTFNYITKHSPIILRRNIFCVIE